MPRAGLTPGRVIAEAAAVADETGLDGLTLATVAHRCGVSLPGLYKHVRGLEEVKRAISLLALREMTTILARAAAGVTGREALHALSAAYRTYALAYPGRYAASVRAPAPGDQEHADAAAQGVAVISAALGGTACTARISSTPSACGAPPAMACPRYRPPEASACPNPSTSPSAT